jgi:hypothetical protein
MSLQIHENIKEKLNYFYELHKIPNILFHGPSGSGKRTIVNEFINKIYENNRDKIKSFVMHVNCSHGKGIKFIREELKFFAKSNVQSNTGVLFKTIVLLNADNLTIDAQSALRRCIELFSSNTRFFIIVENKNKLPTFSFKRKHLFAKNHTKSPKTSRPEPKFETKMLKREFFQKKKNKDWQILNKQQKCIFLKKKHCWPTNQKSLKQVRLSQGLKQNCSKHMDFNLNILSFCQLRILRMWSQISTCSF